MMEFIKRIHNKTLLLLSFSLCFLIACNEDDNKWTESVAVRFNADDMATSATSSESRKEWKATDRIGIYMINAGSTLSSSTIVHETSNREYKPVAEGSSQIVPVADDEEIYFPNSGTVDFIAYSPWKAIGTFPGELNYVYPIDLTKQSESDLLVSRNAKGKSKNTKIVDLEFAHALSQISLTLKAGEGLTGEDLSEISASINMLTEARYMLADGRTIPIEERVGTVGMDIVQTDGGYCTQVLILPGKNLKRKVDFALPEHIGGTVSWEIPDDFVFEPNTQYNWTITLNRTEVLVGNCTISGWNIAADIMIQSTPESWDEPNCYMLNPGESVVIPVQKAYDVWKYHTWFREKEVDLYSQPEVEMVWSDAPSLVRSLTIDGDKEKANITVATNNVHGNALVALKIGGVIRWSWHIWVTDYAPKNENVMDAGKYPTKGGSMYYYDNGTDKTLFMDRNLGAMSATIADPTSQGLRYQWGRKDPFVNKLGWAADMYVTMYDIDDVEFGGREIAADVSFDRGAYTKRIGRGELKYVVESVTEPYIYYDTSDDPWGDRASELWIRKDGSKNLFDPCPAGWRVSHLKSGGDYPWKGLSVTFEQRQEYTENKGYYLEGGGYYPASCLNDGLYPTYRGSYWLANASGGTSAYVFGIGSRGIDNPGYTSRYQKYSVRCVADSKDF